MPAVFDKQRDTLGREKSVGEQLPSTESFGFAAPRRIKAIKSVYIDGMDLAEELLDDLITGLCVEENASCLSVAEISFLNVRSTLLTNQKLWQPQNKVQIWTGYSDTKLHNRGLFRIHRPKYAFTGEQAQLVTLYCVGEEYDLMHTERRKVYSKKRDSDIAIEIAQRHGLAFDVQTTKPVHRQVSQMNENDMKFLGKRARLYGFDFYVNNGILHFHAPRYEYSGLTVYYDSGDLSCLSSIDVEVDTWYRGVNWEATKIDPLTKEQYRVETEEINDPLAATLAVVNNSTIPSELSAINGKVPKRFLIGEGHWQTRMEAQSQVNTFSQNTQYAVRGEAFSSVGIEALKPRQVITILGLGRFSGDYYVTKVVHDLTETYTTYFDVARLGHGLLVDKSILATIRGVGVSSERAQVNMNRLGALAVT